MSGPPHDDTPIQPPAFDDFQFFNPAFHNLLPSPPPIPSSADLFSPSETTDLFGFLENFSWEFDFDLQNVPYHGSPHLDALPPVPSPSQQPPIASSSALPHGVGANPSPQPHPMALDSPLSGVPRSEFSSASPAEPPGPAQASSSPPIPSSMRPKPLLSTPQKRLNHIMSEQKRRNAIRDGYLQLTTLLSPAGAPPGSGMPTRGRPKGSGSRGRGSKGKSGILFKAREYIRFLEEGKGALLSEVLKVEAAAGIRHP